MRRKILTTHIVDKDRNQLDIKYNLQTNEATIINLFAIDGNEKLVTLVGYFSWLLVSSRIL